MEEKGAGFELGTDLRGLEGQMERVRESGMHVVK